MAPLTLGALAQAIGATLEGDATRTVDAVVPLETAGPGDVAVCIEARYRSALPGCKAAAVLVDAAWAALVPPGVVRLVSDTPRASFGKALRLLNTAPCPGLPAPGVDPRAAVAASAELADDVHVGPFATICDGAKLGPGVRVGAYAFVGPGAVLGARTVLLPRATVLDGCTVGADCLLGAGSVIGGPGFGLDAAGRLPHVGTVVIEDGVTLGANTCVDRATLGETRIGAGAQIDNLVQIGHNARVGAGAVLCGQVGLAGGAVVEAGAVLGGQAGVNGGATVGAKARVAAQSGVTKSLAAGGDYSGHPAEPNRVRLKRLAALRRLAERD